MTIRNKFRIFESEWKDFLSVEDLAIPRLQAFIGLPEKCLERVKLVDEGGLSMVESSFVALTTKLRTLEEIQNVIAQHRPGIDASISTMVSNVGAALDFEDIKEQDINETRHGSRLDELGKVAIKKIHLGTLASLNAFIGYAKEYERDHEKTMQAASSMINSAELKIKHTPYPPIMEVNKRLAKFTALAKRIIETGIFILEDHLM